MPTWLIVVLCIVAAILLWGLLMARAIVKSLNAKLVRDKEPGEEFSLHFGARSVRVDGLVVSLKALEEDRCTVALSSANEPAKRVMLHAPGAVADTQSSEVLGKHRVRLIDVSADAGNKVSLFRAMLVVDRDGPLR